MGCIIAALESGQLLSILLGALIVFTGCTNLSDSRLFRTDTVSLDDIVQDFGAKREHEAEPKLVV